MFKAFQSRGRGYGLTTAEIRYRLPDQPWQEQLYVWREYDQAPNFPSLKGFLDFWNRELDGLPQSVRIAHKTLAAPQEWRAIDGVFKPQ